MLTFYYVSRLMNNTLTGPPVMPLSSGVNMHAVEVHAKAAEVLRAHFSTAEEMASGSGGLTMYHHLAGGGGGGGGGGGSPSSGSGSGGGGGGGSSGGGVGSGGEDHGGDLASAKCDASSNFATPPSARTAAGQMLYPGELF